MDVSQIPTVGRIVHFVASNVQIVNGDGSINPDVRAMLITAVGELDGQIFVNGMVFRNDVHDQKLPQPITEVTQVPRDDNHSLGTWHWPKRI